MKFVFDIDGTICYDVHTIDPMIRESLKDLQDKDMSRFLPQQDLIEIVLSS